MAVSVKERELESQLRVLAAFFGKRGVEVRREKLARGFAFRVKSGDCVFSGDKVIFVDRRLPLEQQVSLLVDYVFELGFDADAENEEGFSDGIKKLFAVNRIRAAA